MRKNVIPIPPDLALGRVLAGLEPELVEASDEDIVQAAEDLGMDLKMKGSAAYMGLLYGIPKRIEDVFDVQDLRDFYARFLPKDE